MMKLVKEKNKYLRYFNEVFKFNAGLERFIASIFMMLFICHLVACFWFTLADFSSTDTPDTWISRANLYDAEDIDKYSIFFLLFKFIFEFKKNNKEFKIFIHFSMLIIKLKFFFFFERK